jgi:peptidoglycan-associated lipoprotein
MHASYKLLSLIGAIGLILVIGSGCSKSIDAGAGSQSMDSGAKKGEGSKEAGKGQEAQASGGVVEEQKPLKGFEKEPKEERLGGGGTMVAKADSDTTKQADERMREQAAASAAGLVDVFFGYDSWKITDEGKNILARDADWLKANAKQKALVEGHCDERGTQAYNLVLGEKRAKSVKNYLVELGVKGDRLQVRSFGKEKPFCNEHDESCYQQNRRAHVVVKQ